MFRSDIHKVIGLLTDSLCPPNGLFCTFTGRSVALCREYDMSILSPLTYPATPAGVSSASAITRVNDDLVETSYLKVSFSHVMD